MKKHAMVTAMEKAVKVLVYISETDSALEPIFCSF